MARAIGWNPRPMNPGLPHAPLTSSATVVAAPREADLGLTDLRQELAEIRHLLGSS